MSKYHEPVLLNESVDGLNIDSKGVYVDVTFGGGGHSRAILSKLDGGHLYAFDQDDEALNNDIEDEGFTLINANFRYLKNSLRMYGVKEVDGLLADLGVSSHQFDVADRGFSIRFESDLDMRMDHDLEQDAAYILNNYNAKNLSRIFREHADFHSPNFIVKKILCHREKNSIKTTYRRFMSLTKSQKWHFQNFRQTRIY